MSRMSEFPAGASAIHRRAPSLRRRLLTILAVPMTLAWIVCGALIYVLALHYANINYDRSLLEDARALERMIRSDAGDEQMSPQARILMEDDSSDPTYYVVRSLHHGVLASNLDLPMADPVPAIDAPPRLDSITYANRSLRMASLTIALDDSGDHILISVAETLHERHALAREILSGTLPVMLLLVALVLVLVWFGVSRGLRLLDPLANQIAERRARDLSALDQSVVPVEILPLAQKIDALFARLRDLLDVQERFIADAAHQLRTPLAGLRLQAERALADPRPESVRAALIHVERLSAGAGRAAGQLLALARAQTSNEDDVTADIVDLARLARDYMAERVPDALAMGVDLGYEGPAQDAQVGGDAVMLREVLVNLIDNALNYAGENGTVTVSIEREARNVVLAVEDSGAGVAEEWWPRLGERFFRPPGSHREGSGLGLAIVRHVAARHRAALTFGRGDNARGFRVTLRLGAVTPDQSQRSSRV
jgi:two-component system sensor histidine kinase TctE